MNFHPERELLEQHAAGTLPLPFALGVAVHLSYCAQCRAEMQALQNLGGLLLEELQPAAIDARLLQSVMERIECCAQPEKLSPHSGGVRLAAGLNSASSGIPQPLRHLVPNGYDALSWTRILPGLRVVKLDLGDGDYHVALHRMCAGGKVGRHDHRGLEMTVVLNGSFSDEYGVYGDGDFIVRTPSQIHRPLVAQNEECISLAVQTGPVRFTQHVWRLLNPFLA